MRVMLVIVAAAAALLVGLRAGHAYPQGRWCAVQSIGAGFVTETCSYETLEQCVPEVIAGNRGFCKENMRWPGRYGVVERPKRHHKQHARHH